MDERSVSQRWCSRGAIALIALVLAIAVGVHLRLAMEHAKGNYAFDLWCNAFVIIAGILTFDVFIRIAKRSK